MPKSISPIELGKRIAAARKERNVSQEDAAKHLGVSRPTYIAIERGSRAAKAEEIISLAAYFGKSVNDLVSPRSTITEFAPQFRVTQSATAEPIVIDEAVGAFKQACNDYLWLEHALNAPMPKRVDIDEYPISNVAPAVIAEDIAQMERSRLNLGMGPIADLAGTLEAEAGIRVFALPVEEFRVAGMFVFNDQLGGCIMVNGSHPVTRQAWSLAHEYAHYLTNRYHNEVTVLIEYERKPKAEQFADHFAASFLMPAPGIRRRFNSIVQSRKDFSVADLCVMADQYAVSVEAMARRLERLGCLPQGTWQTLEDRSVSGKRARKEIGLDSRPPRRVILPRRYVRLAVQAFDEELITETQLARFLRCSRVEAREIADAASVTEEINVNAGGTYQLSLTFGDSIGPTRDDKEAA
ncbi:MAG: XRE family transcriptional regulator [Capsulimonadaceae bacterium]|nr:XRE family transcriptional regulator [Capsulimonadaceae bacterium]